MNCLCICLFEFA